VYIWSATQRPNINYYLDQIWHETQITINPLKVLGKKCYTQNAHFLLANPNKIVFHKNLNPLFFKYHDTHANNMLFLDDTTIHIDNLEWNSTFLFSTIPIYRLVHIFVLQKFIVKCWCTFIEKNYIGIFIIRLLLYNQFQIFNLISFIICYRCPKKEHFAKVDIVMQKMNHLNVHSPNLIFFSSWTFTFEINVVLTLEQNSNVYIEFCNRLNTKFL